MLQLELDVDEARVLRDALKTYLADLRMEIGLTDQLEYREKLKRVEGRLRELLQRLPA